MSKRISTNAIKIKKTEYEKLMAWSLSFQEIGALCFGRNGRITNVVRIPNLIQSKNYFVWNKDEKERALKKAKSVGLELIAEMHSHPSKYHLKRPSSMDLKYFKGTRLHIISFPNEMKLTVWDLKARQPIGLEC